MTDISTRTNETISERKPVEYIDMTPKWAGIMPILIMSVEEHTTGYSDAVSELNRLARIADQYNEVVKKLDVNVLSNIIREVDGNHNLGAGELAEKILEKIWAKT